MSRGLVVDAAPQQRARQALRAAERLSRAVVEGLEEGVIVLDPRLRPVSWNVSALRILGVSADEIAAADARDLLFARDTLRYDSGKSLSAQDNPAQRALRQGAPVRATLRRAMPNGSERWITILARPIGGAHGTNRRGVVATVADVTGSVEGAQRLREERDRAQRYLEVASTLVVVLDAAGCVELVNRQGCELLGYSEHELVGRDWHETVIPPGDRPEARAAFQQLLAGEEPPPERAETFLLTKGGEERKIAWRNALVRDARGTVTSVLSSGEDVTERRRAEAQVAYLAHHDRLTGLPNRALLEEQLQRDLARARRTGGAVALVQVGLDNFKLVNDSLGHGAGDAVLRETAQRVAELTRAGDVIARQGGDEFMLLLDCGAEDAQVVAQLAGDRIMEALEQPFAVAGAEFHIGAAIGIALFPGHANNAESLFKHADMAMHQAKRAGGGTVAFYERGASEARDRLSLTSRLRRAIESDELRLHFQPIYRVEDGQLVAVEALVRWEDPEHGLVPPAGFIPVAEETGLIEGIGTWVVEALCKQAARWAKEGFRPRLCFNLSPRQLRQPDLVASIAQAIARYELPAGQFCAELTESAVMSDERRDSSLLDELHAAGLAIAIDDFGSGHSSLARLRDLPVQVLKVDRSFLRRVPEDPGSTAIVAAVLELGAALGMTTVVEGVEHPEQLALLRRHGAPLAQGFLLGRPVPAEQLDRSPARVTA
ncbi:bifunctional diguanylate cyclase/phosphodiesterase [Conexibacter sp. CPCC 206217]|uniref:putative bifunctional diguanylate cyclase/phosphodiesterase n=1 Tax=Conexibacter sp. CPCC 206217 TaxID=3064574 RepID=UPI002724E16A|nr:bifunctional diguanylate cyclase/phosphodiesterase [Conexibacter sp. CPCC 206217]MDO8211314.1 EAL domain-containing protein [Conexibacter sp. CPCC 206217]